MATEKHEPIDVGEVEVPTSPRWGQADPRQNQPPSATPNKSIAISSGCKTDVENSNIESPERKTLMTSLKLAVGLSVRPRETIHKYRVESQIKPLDEYVRGYGSVAAFEDCDPCFLVYRKFGWLHNRVLLHLQDELQVLEEELEEFDKDEAINSKPIYQQSRRKDDARPDSERSIMLKQIKEKLGEYDDVSFRLQKLHAIKKPTARDQASLYQRVCNNMVASETSWVRRTEDLAALAPDAEYGYFNGFLVDMLNKISKNALLAIFRTKDQRIKTGSDPRLVLVSPERFDALLRAVLPVLAAVLILVPIIILFELQPENASQVRSRSKYQVLNIFLSTLFASASCSIFTKARKQEVFTATAAYCAFLAMFWGITSQVMVTSNGG